MLQPAHDPQAFGTPDRAAPDRLTTLARLLFDAPDLLVRLTERQDDDAVDDGTPTPVPTASRAPSGTGGPPDAERPRPCFRAVAPLRTREGRRIGTLHLAAPEPRPAGATDADRCRLEALAGVAADLLEARLRLRHAAEALAEKDLLAREADHRVANGLQLVHGALCVQAKAAPDTTAQVALRAAALRVAAVAGAHRHLHRAPAMPAAGTAPDPAGYLAPLLRDLATPDRPVVLDAAPGAEAAVPAGLLPRLGLVAAELVANALKHGAGRVLVELRPAPLAEGGGAVLAVSDEGPGFPPGFDPEASGREGLGMRLVAALARPGRARIDPKDRRRILLHLADRPASIPR